MLSVRLALLRRGPVEVAGSIDPRAELFGDLDFRVLERVGVRGVLSETGPGTYYWRGSIATVVEVACGRCLTVVRHEVTDGVEVLFTEDEGTDDPSAYIISEGCGELVFDEMVREQLILALPDYPLCRKGCAGLCARCGKNLNDRPCDCKPETDPRWAALEALHVHGDDKEN